MSVDQQATRLRIALFNADVDYESWLSEALSTGNLSAEVESIHTMAAFAAAISSQRWDAVIIAYAVSQSALQTIQAVALTCPVVILCEAQDEDAAFAHTSPLVAQVMPISRRSQLPFILRHELALHGHGRHADAVDLKPDMKQIEESLQELEALYNATSHLFKADSLQQLGNQIVETVTQAFEQTDCGLLLIDSKRNGIFRLARMGEYKVRAYSDHFLPLDGQGLVPAAIKTGDLLYVPDVTQDARYLPSEGRTRSELVIPLKATTGVIGVLDLQHTDIDAFSERDQRIIAAYAERAAVAIENMRLYEAINQHAADLEQHVRDRTVALQATKDRVEAILNNSLDGILLAKSDLRIQQANPAAARLLKVDFDSNFGMRFLDLIHPEDASRVNALIQAVLTQAKGQSTEARVLCGDGTRFDAELTFGTIEADGLVCTIHDITARKRIELAVAEERNLLRTLIDAIPDYIYIKDIHHRTVVSNLARARSFGLTPEETVGKDDFAFVPAELANNFHADEDALFQTGEPLFNREERTIGQDGSVIWATTTKVPLHNLSGELIGLAGATRDITERKRAEEQLRESEEKYRRLIETMRGGLVMYDSQERITYANDHFCEMLGYPLHELIGRSAYDFVDDVNADVMREKSKGRQRGRSSSYEMAARRKDGQPIHFVVFGSPLLDKSGNQAGSIAVVTDISTQKQAETVLRQALAKEQELGDLKSRFVSMASHEFRTPLATILALTDTLSAYRHRMTEEQIEQRLTKIQQQIGHLKNIMDDVLHLARLQARRAEFNPHIFDLDALCRNVLDEFQSQPTIKHQLVYTCTHAPLLVELDAKLMRQILVNLVSNAIKYSPESSAPSLSLSYVDGEVQLSVHDDGIGIPPSDIENLFEPFHRASNVGVIPGTGLGLVIVKESVELHGGTISVDSQLGAGTTITIKIPAAIVSTLTDNIP